MLPTIRAWFAIGLIVLSLTAPSDHATAADCGFPPTEEPFIADGRAAGRDELQLSIQAVRLYSNIVNGYLNCLDTARTDRFLNMTAEQQERWTEDYNAIVDRLAEIETGINDQIRIFNQRRDIRDADDNSP